MIACILMPDLVTAVECGQNPALKGYPLLLLNSKGQVRAASLDASRQGARAGMRVRQAMVFCPDAQILPLNSALYQETIEALLDKLGQFTNRIEVAPGFWNRRRKERERQPLPLSAGVLYLDLGKLGDKAELMALGQQMNLLLDQKAQIASQVGLASNKFTADVAARLARHGQVRLIPSGLEAEVLAALPITLLPLESEILRRLKLLGIGTLGQLAALPPGALLEQFGKAGRLMYQLAQGQDERPVLPLVATPVEHLTLQLHGAVEDRLALEAILHSMACDLERKLEIRGYTTRTLELLLHLENGDMQQESTVLRQPTNQGERIGRSLARLLSQCQVSSGVTQLDVKVTDLHPIMWRQLDLFGTAFTTQDKTRQLLESLTARFGDDAFYQVAVNDPQHRLPERRFQIERVEAA